MLCSDFELFPPRPALFSPTGSPAQRPPALNDPRWVALDENEGDAERHFSAAALFTFNGLRSGLRLMICLL